MKKTNMHTTGSAGKMFRNAVLCSVSGVALLAAPAFAQDAAAAADDETVVVITGVRGSLQRSMNIKKNATGIVDAISAEDIGKYPDTNLAESIQRIPGVSISRVNGEGSEVTVRGFGPSFNMVTLNGRSMPTANIAAIGGDQQGETVGGGSRSFDFGNIASDGVTGFEVYKTGKAHVQPGGIGATLNIKTLRPITTAGSTGSLTVKGLKAGDEDITPEISGAYSWSNDDRTFGVSIFGAHSQRKMNTRSATVNGWDVVQRGATGSMVDSTTVITNDASPTDLVAYPKDSRYHVSDVETERTNVQATAQWRPSESWLFTLDALYVQSEGTEQRLDQTNWFNRNPFGALTLAKDAIHSVVVASETISGVKDIGFEQQIRSNKDTLSSIGFNAQWYLNERTTIAFDIHSSKGEVRPNNSDGSSSATVSFGAPVIAAHSVDYRSGVPVQSYTFNDSISGNNNGVLDIGDLGSQIARTWGRSQTHQVDEARIDVTYDFDGESRFDFGVNLRRGDLTTASSSTELVLGDWGITQVGDIEQYAGGLVETFCMSCQFKEFNIGNQPVAFRANALDLYEAMAKGYGKSLPNRGVTENNIIEDVVAAYGQLTLKADFLGLPTSIVAGLRYEKTKVKASAMQSVPTSIRWASDNDFFVETTGGQVNFSQEGEYSNWLPNIDVSVNLRDDLIARASFSKTIARPNFSDLYAITTVNGPGEATVSGKNPLASRGNPGLLPLESSNVDFSLEWYYGTSNYVSFGYYNKDVANFIGTGVVRENHFGLRDPSSGVAGSRSGTARTALSALNLGPTDVNLFTMTALLIENNGDVAAATADFQTGLVGGALDQGFVNNVLARVDIWGDANDPLFNFETEIKLNNRNANIHGFEFSGQHFFGDTGFGVAYSMTTVEGDVEFDRAAQPGTNQFALLGLSDTYNVTLIYDKGPLSGRLSYNWRDTYLAGTSRDGSSNNPTYIEEFGVIDLSVNYQLTSNVQLTFEGLNLGKETLRTHSRDKTMLYFAQELDSRYQIGVRYKF